MLGFLVMITAFLHISSDKSSHDLYEPALEVGITAGLGDLVIEAGNHLVLRRQLFSQNMVLPLLDRV